MVKGTFEPMSLSFELHKLFNNIQLPFLGYKDLAEVRCINGIYVMFEKGELFKNYKRIVKIGINKESNNFNSRLKAHYKGTKDGSILRKYVGDAILNKRNDFYLKVWNMDTSNRESFIEKNPNLLDLEYQKTIEEEVSDYIRNNIFFTYFKIENNEMRKVLEKKIIATVWRNPDFIPSANWLGKFCSEKYKQVSEYGLWLKQGLKSEPFTQEEFERFYEYIAKQYNLK